MSTLKFVDVVCERAVTYLRAVFGKLVVSCDQDLLSSTSLALFSASCGWLDSLEFESTHPPARHGQTSDPSYNSGEETGDIQQDEDSQGEETHHPHHQGHVLGGGALISGADVASCVGGHVAGGDLQLGLYLLRHLCFYLLLLLFLCLIDLAGGQ